MAHTAEQIVSQTLGNLLVQSASLQAMVEQLQEANTTLQARVQELEQALAK